MTDKPGKNPDAWLDDESTVSRAYGELKKAVPPAHLDEHILAEARRAAATQDHTVIRVQRWRKWTMPAALAATVVFAVPLVVRVFDSPQPIFDVDPSMAKSRSEQAAGELGLDKSQYYGDPPAREGVADPSNAIRPQTMVEVATPAEPQATPSPVSYDDEGHDKETQAPLDAFSAHVPFRQTSKEHAATFGTDESSVDIRETGRVAAPSIADDTQTFDAATGEVFAEAPPDQENGKRSVRDDAIELDYAGSPVHAPDAKAAGIADPGPELKERTNAFARSERQRASTDRIEAQSTGFAVENADAYPSSPMATTTADPDIEEVLVTSTALPEPEQWLADIASQHRNGLVRAARRELGSFLTEYPDYLLPDDYPLQAGDALFDGDTSGEIIPEAAAWLRGIGLMAERGEIDQARTQLAEFFAIYPNYPLPADFPLTREDALPIER